MCYINKLALPKLVGS